MNKRVIIKDGLVYTINHLDEEYIATNMTNLIEIKYCKLISSLYMLKHFPIIMMYLNTGSLDGLINTKIGTMEKGRFLFHFIAIFTPVALSISKK